MKKQALLVSFPHTDSPSCFRNQKPYSNKLDSIQPNTNSEPSTVTLQLSQLFGKVFHHYYTLCNYLFPAAIADVIMNVQWKPDCA